MANNNGTRHSPTRATRLPKILCLVMARNSAQSGHESEIKFSATANSRTPENFYFLSAQHLQTLATSRSILLPTTKG